MKRILVSNDDGIHAPGLLALVEALEPLAEVTVMAPLTEQSATSHALTLHQPLRLRETAPRRFAVEGTPTDCVLLAVNEFMAEKPDLVVSGINQGPNMGEDVIYSGTVAAAMEGAILGIPSMAVSLVSRTAEFNTAARITAGLAQNLLARDLPRQFLINVNIPPGNRDTLGGIRITRLGNRIYRDVIIKKVDPRGKDYYWIGGGEPKWVASPDTDFSAVSENQVSVTPLLMDLTDAKQLDFLRGLGLSLTS